MYAKHVQCFAVHDVFENEKPDEASPNMSAHRLATPSPQPRLGLLSQKQIARRPESFVLSMSSLSDSQLQDYLQRVKAGRKRKPDGLSPVLSTLNELHFAHLTHIPFENLSLHHPIVRLPSCCARHDCGMQNGPTVELEA